MTWLLWLLLYVCLLCAALQIVGANGKDEDE